MSGRFVLALLFVVSLFNYLDRWMLAILLPDIKRDLSLSDSEIGFISGIAFSLFYALMGIPIARLADRYSRRVIVSTAMAVWSAMTAICGLAQSFWQLAIARVMVGVGEAGATPPSHSLISDLYPKERRAFALSVYALGSPLGIFLGFLLGGWLTQNFGWRVALFTFGIPGLLLAFLVYWKLPEPPRGAADNAASDEPTPRLPVVLRTLFSRPTYVHNCIGSGLYTMVYIGLINWTPSYFERNHELSIATIGTWLAFVGGGAQLLGVLGGGWLADRLSSRSLAWLMRLCALAVFLAIPFYSAAVLAPTPELGFALLIVPFVASTLQAGPQHATTQGVSPVAMRATAAATYLLIVNLLGGVGTQLVGFLSDYLRADYGDMGLGWAIIIVATVFSLWSALHFAIASRTLVNDMARAG